LTRIACKAWRNAKEVSYHVCRNSTRRGVRSDVCVSPKPLTEGRACESALRNLIVKLAQRLRLRDATLLNCSLDNRNLRADAASLETL
jgi:hypothetical protein